MRFILLAALALLHACAPAPAPRAAPAPTLLVGTTLERNYSTQPGVQVGYLPAGARLRYTAAYSTTRLETAAGSNALVEDRVQLGAGWYFRPVERVSPYVSLQAGWTRFDRDDDPTFQLLDHQAPLLSVSGGMEAAFGPRLRGSAGLGWSALASSTVYPLVATLGVHYRVTGRSGR